MTVKFVGDDYIVSVRVEAQDGAAAGAAAEESALLVMGQAVGAVSALTPDCYLVSLVVTAVDSTGCDVGE